MVLGFHPFKEATDGVDAKIEQIQERLDTDEKS
jgi:hypothetical protein